MNFSFIHPLISLIDRGEGLNHGILDIYALVSALQRIHEASIAASDQAQVRIEAIVEYEKEIRLRGRHAVLLSREACLQAHQWDKLNEDAAVLKRRTRPDSWAS